MVGREWSFPPRFIEEVARRKADVEAEFVKIGATAMNEPVPYAVIVDRISHEVPYYRSYLKNAVLQGVTVVNNPFMWSADDKFFDASLATRLGVASPKTMALPNKAYIPGIVPEESLRNLVYPLDWKGIVEYIGMPCILKDAHGGGWKEVLRLPFAGRADLSLRQLRPAQHESCRSSSNGTSLSAVSASGRSRCCP
jgi:hypothetical protein